MTPDQLIQWAWAIGWSLLILVLPVFVFGVFWQILRSLHSKSPKQYTTNVFNSGDTKE